MRKNFIKIILFIAVLFAVSTIYGFISGGPLKRVVPENAVADLTGIDFSVDKVRVAGINWEYYGSELYTPEDFANGGVKPPVIEATDGADADYATHRVTLKLPKGKTYGIYGWSMLTSMRLYINGSLALEVGFPGKTKETTMPRSQFYFYAFAPETDTTELIYHVSSFYTSDDAGRYSFIINDFSRMFHDIYLNLFTTTIMAGCLVAAFLFYLGMFIFTPGKRSFLFFSVSCLLTAARFTVMDAKPLMALFPGISWFAGYATEYLTMVLLLMFCNLYIDALYPKLLHRIYLGVILAGCALYAAVTNRYFIRVYTRFMLYFSVFAGISAIVSILLIIVRFIKKKPKYLADVMLLIGFSLIAVSAVDEAANKIIHINLGALPLANAMIGCVMIHMVALALDFSRSEIELINARAVERELTDTNRSLDQLNRMKSELIATVSHETRTPLAVLSGYAELISKELRRKGVDEQTAKDLDKITDETQRIAGLIDVMQKLVRDKDHIRSKTRLNLGGLIDGVTRLYSPIFTRKNTRLISDGIPENIPDVYADANGITQVFFNLLQNAHHHTENGAVTVSVAAEENFISVTVADTGSGIPPEIMPRLFERGVSGDIDGSGFGLAICKEIIDAHGGVIEITAEPGGGTAARFTLPIFIEKEENDGTQNDPAC